jgi:hypothetical protein
MFGWHCKVVGCSCGQFEPAGNTGPPPVVISFEPDEPVEKIVAAFEAGSKGATGPPSDPTGAVAGPPDLHQAIQAATTALCDQHPAIGLSDPWAQVARIAVEAAWPHAEGVIANARDKVDRKREANAAMQRQADDDLHQAIQAIQAATGALRELSTWPREQCEFAARTATVAAAPVLLQATRDRLALPQCPECREPMKPDEPRVAAWSSTYWVHQECGDDSDRAGVNPLQQLRDRLADLEVYAAELRDLLEQSIGHTTISMDGLCSYDGGDPSHAHCWWCGQLQVGVANSEHLADCHVAAVLQVDGPARGHAILDEVQRLHALLDEQDRCHNCGVTRKGATHRSVSIGVCEITLDQAAEREVSAHPFVAEQRSNLCLLFVQGGRTCGKERDDPIHALDQAAQREVDR